MATKTLGTNGTTTLTAIQWQPGGISAADLATIMQAIKNDIINTNPNWPQTLQEGILYIPNRGQLILQPGDWIGVDGSGWPVLVSNGGVTASWTHS